jgi:DNA replication protein DnaC
MQQQMCPMCHFPTGECGWMVWRGQEGPDGKGNFRKRGEAVPCRHNEGMIDTTLAALSGLSFQEQQVTLADFWDLPGRERALGAAKLIQATWSGMLGLYGGTGTGKTRLMMALVNAARGAKVSTTYMTLPGLLDRLRDAYNPDSPVDSADLFGRLCRARVLAIDEADKHSPTLWAQEKWSELLDERYRSAHDKATLIAFNDREVVPGYILSRLKEHSLVEMTCGDLRPKLAQLSKSEVMPF